MPRVEYVIGQRDASKIKKLMRKAYRDFDKWKITKGADEYNRYVEDKYEIRLIDLHLNLSDMIADLDYWDGKYYLTDINCVYSKSDNTKTITFIFESDPLVDRDIRSHLVSSIKQKILETIREKAEKGIPYSNFLIPKEIHYRSFGEKDLYDWLVEQNIHFSIKDNADGKKKLISIIAIHSNKE